MPFSTSPSRVSQHAARVGDVLVPVLSRITRPCCRYLIHRFLGALARIHASHRVLLGRIRRVGLGLAGPTRRVVRAGGPVVGRGVYVTAAAEAAPALVRPISPGARPTLRDSMNASRSARSTRPVAGSSAAGRPAAAQRRHVDRRNQALQDVVARRPEAAPQVRRCLAHVQQRRLIGLRLLAQTPFGSSLLVSMTFTSCVPGAAHFERHREYWLSLQTKPHRVVHARS